MVKWPPLPPAVGSAVPSVPASSMARVSKTASGRLPCNRNMARLKTLAQKLLIYGNRIIQPGRKAAILGERGWGLYEGVMGVEETIFLWSDL